MNGDRHVDSMHEHQHEHLKIRNLLVILGATSRRSEFGTWNKTRRYPVLPIGIHTRDSESYTRSLRSVLKEPAFKLLI